MKKVVKRARQRASIGCTIGKVAGMFVTGNAAVGTSGTVRDRKRR